MKLKLQKTPAGNHHFYYLTGKHKMFNVTVSVISFLQKFVQAANFPVFFQRRFFYKMRSVYIDAEILLHMIFFCKHLLHHG